MVSFDHYQDYFRRVPLGEVSKDETRLIEDQPGLSAHIVRAFSSMDIPLISDKRNDRDSSKRSSSSGIEKARKLAAIPEDQENENSELMDSNLQLTVDEADENDAQFDKNILEKHMIRPDLLRIERANKSSSESQHAAEPIKNGPV